MNDSFLPMATEFQLKIKFHFTYLSNKVQFPYQKVRTEYFPFRGEKKRIRDER